MLNIQEKITPLHKGLMENESIKSIEKLLKNGADVNAKDYHGRTPLHSAIDCENLPAAQLLIKHGVRVNCKDDNQQTPLHRAVMNTDAEKIIELLLSSGADIHAKDSRGSTALHVAISHNDNLAIIRLLLEHGASVNCRDELQQTPLHRAVAGPCDQSTEVAELLLTNGADVNAKDINDQTPLHLTVAEDSWACLDIVSLLIKQGASVNCKDKRQRTPLHGAVTRSSLKSLGAVELLLDSGADANAKDSEGDRPLHLYTFKRPLNDECTCIFLMLWEQGAYVNAQNHKGESALFHALTRSDEGMVKELLKYGANLNDSDVQLALTKPPVVPFILMYLEKLKVAKLLPEEAFANISFSGSFSDSYLVEIEKLKSTFIDNCKSLYDFLKMDVIRRSGYTSNEKLRKLVESIELGKQFRDSLVLILGRYHEAVTRRSLMEITKEALYELIQVRLPDSDDQILSYLTEVDLINLLESSVHQDKDNDRIMNADRPHNVLKERIMNRNLSVKCVSLVRNSLSAVFSVGLCIFKKYYEVPYT